MADWRVGDLAMVVAPSVCCGDDGGIGAIFKVIDLYIGVSCCSACNRRNYLLTLSEDEKCGYIASRCIRIDPPALAESAETGRKVGEPSSV